MALNTSGHTTKAFDADLQNLSRLIAEMGGCAERQLAEVIEALTTHDRNRAQAVVTDDTRVDALQRKIEELAVAVIATRQPMAVDLRDVVAILRTATELERIGDLAKNIGKRVAALNGEDMPRKALRGVRHMAALTLNQLHQVLDSFARRDSMAAFMVWSRDEEIDAMYTSLFRELLTYMMEDPRNITSCTHLLFCAKNIERIGDHATNIAETVYYMVEGHPMIEQRPKGDTTAFAKAPAK